MLSPTCLLLFSLFVTTPPGKDPHAVEAAKLFDAVVAASSTGDNATAAKLASTALPVLDRAAGVFKSNPRFHFARGLALILKEDRPGCLKALQKAYKLAPGHSGAIMKDGRVHPMFGATYALALKMNLLPVKSREVLTEMASVHPENVAVSYMLLQLHLSLQEYAKALPMAQKMLKGKAVNLTILLTAQGESLLYLGRVDAAVKALKGALSATPDAATPMTFLAEAYLVGGDAAGARTLLEGGLKKHPRAPDLRFLHALALERQGQKSAAATAWRVAFDLLKARKPQDNGREHLLFSRAAARLGESAVAKRHQQQAKALHYVRLATDPRSPPAAR